MLSNLKNYLFQKNQLKSYGIVYLLLLLAIIVYSEFIKLYWPQNYKFSFGSLTFVIMTIWTYYACVQFYGYNFAFHQICYYLTIRFKQCNKSLKKLLQDHEISSLNKILVEHNSICQLVSEYNTFWKIILFIDALMYSSLLCFTTYLGIFSSLKLWVKYMFAFLNICGMFCFLIIFFSAAFMSSEVSTEQVIKILIKLKKIFRRINPICF